MQATSQQDGTDNHLVALLKNEHTRQKGFRQLVQQYQERLYWHIRRMVTHHEDANDVIQNTFIKVFRSIHNFKGDSKLYTWLYRIATNEAITHLNKQKKRSTDPLDNEDLNLNNRLKADQYFDGDAVQLKLQNALAQLPERQKLVFNMRYFDEMTYKEIADVLEVSIGGLKASYHHAVKKIEDFFKTN